MSKAISVLVHGEAGSGKSTFGVTGPTPRLLMDCESGYRFLDIKSKLWDPMKEDPPEADGTWDTCVVTTKEWKVMSRVYEKYLKTGNHPFNTVIVDSLSELQQQCLEAIAGRNQMQTQQWGQLLRDFSGMMRDLRDLTEHPTHPVSAVVLTAMSGDVDGKMRPYLQGKSGTVAPFYYDICGYMAEEEYPHPDPTQGKYKVRRLYIDGTDKFLAKSRVQRKLGVVVEQGDLDITKLLDKIFSSEETLP